MSRFSTELLRSFFVINILNTFMDKETIATYDREAQSIAKLHATLTPNRIYELIMQYFIKGGATADIGCGIGRDTQWLNQKGYPSIGVDASPMMLEQAQSLYPMAHYIQDTLPDLKLLGTKKFQNILCSAVLMHLNQNDLERACIRLIELLKDNGRVILSFRGTNEINYREKGKLYEPIELDKLLSFFHKNSCIELLTENEMEISRNLTWHNLVLRK